MQPIIDHDRVSLVAKALSRIPLSSIKVIEYSDPQYEAVKKIALAYGVTGIVAVIANSLVSYRLPVQGETYWKTFAEYLSTRRRPGSFEDLLATIEEFVSSTVRARALASQKLGRIRKALGALQELYTSPYEYRDLAKLLDLLTTHMRGRGVEKTIVFAAKMAYYFYTALGYSVSNANTVPLPVDRRVAILTSTSRIIRAPVRDIMGRYLDTTITVWRRVSELAGIPLINMDAVIWLPARGITGLLQKGLDFARDEYAKRLVEYSRSTISWSVARGVAIELLHEYPIE